MKEDAEKRLTDAIIDLGVGMKELRDEMKAMRKDMNQHQQETNHRLEKLEKHQTKTNLALGELRLSYMKMSDEVSCLRADLNGKIDGLRSDFNKYASSNNKIVNGHETRIGRLEEKSRGNSYIARESASEYKRKKKK